MSKYPEDLINWSGDKSGGVKKLFYSGSGRPSGSVITTPLLTRLRAWVHALARGEAGTPRVIFLVGGPGNGKTEAVEYTIREIDEAMGLDGALLGELAARFSGESGVSPGRLVSTISTKFPTRSGIQILSIVQDGSEAGLGDSATPAEHLCNDIRFQVDEGDEQVYIACVNRGVLDDALILATELGDWVVGEVLKKIIQAASLSAHGASCWPLDGYPRFAIWPMDVESLVEESGATGGASACRQILAVATNADEWPAYGECPAGTLCPFCTNRKLLAVEANASSFIQILRRFELASGKRWNFRDQFSLVAYLLAGAAEAGPGVPYHPCNWAKAQLEPKESNQAKREARVARALFRLLAAQYQHALFCSWPAERGAGLRADIKDLRLDEQPSVLGLMQFLALDRRKDTTTTLRSQLNGMVEHLDPATASPEFEVGISSNKVMQLKELDRLFSLSVKGGRELLHKHRCLSELENRVLRLLESADEKLSEEPVRRRKPAAAQRVQALVRLVACTIARRSLAVRAGVTRDSDVLSDFEKVLRGDDSAFQDVRQQLEGLLNKGGRFQVSLNTTFGEPLPPPERRVMLTTDKQKVLQMPLLHDESRPRLPVRFLTVGAKKQPVALTYELFKATQSLRKGMVPASLPRSVVALLDTTRAKLAGIVVRNEDELEGSEIHLGIREDVISRNFGKFIITGREGS